jgi:predicted amidophosphoribosyltransferase
MYYCNDCREFVTGKTYEVGPESIEPPETVCEFCGSDDIEQADNCPYCGDPIRSEQDMCDGCRETAENIIKKAVSEIESVFLVSSRTAKQILESILDE